MQILTTSYREVPPTHHLAQGLNPLITTLQQHGVDPRPILSKAGVSDTALKDLMFLLTAEQELGFTEIVIDTLEQPDIGLTIGSQYHLAAYGVLGLAIMTAPDLLEAVKVVHKHTLMTWTYMEWTLSLENNMAHNTLKPLLNLGASYRFMIDRGLIASYLIMKEALGTDFPLSQVNLTLSESSYADRYADLFNCPINFSAPVNGFCFDPEYLKHPLFQSDPNMHAVFCAEAEKICDNMEQKFGFQDLVRQHILNYEGQQNSLEHLADKFCTTPRTIQRKLSGEGTSYRKILEIARQDLAIDYLRSTKMTIEVIASKLGYNDASAFCHAFKRWTGKQPSAYR